MPRNSYKLIILLFWLFLLSGCGINNIPTFDEQVKSSWSQVENQYQRRADLIPNLVETVKGYAAHEKETLMAVVEARSKVGGLQAAGDLINNPEKLQQFEQAQASSILASIESCPSAIPGKQSAPHEKWHGSINFCL